MLKTLATDVADTRGRVWLRGTPVTILASSEMNGEVITETLLPGGGLAVFASYVGDESIFE